MSSAPGRPAVREDGVKELSVAIERCCAEREAIMGDVCRRMSVACGYNSLERYLGILWRKEMGMQRF